MAKIYEFPGSKKPHPTGDSGASVPSLPSSAAFSRRALAGLSRGLWTVIVLAWPVLRWVLSVDVFLRLLVMLYHWDTPGTYAGWTFLLHATVLVAMTYYVSIYRPHGLER